MWKSLTCSFCEIIFVIFIPVLLKMVSFYNFSSLSKLLYCDKKLLKIFLFLCIILSKITTELVLEKLSNFRKWLTVESCPTACWIAFSMLYQLVYSILSYLNGLILEWSGHFEETKKVFGSSLLDLDDRVTWVIPIISVSLYLSINLWNIHTRFWKWKWSFPLRISSVNMTKSTVSCDTFTEEILNEKFHFLCSVMVSCCLCARMSFFGKFVGQNAYLQMYFWNIFCLWKLSRWYLYQDSVLFF